LSGYSALPSAEQRYKNWEIAVLALFLQGGASKRVHTEDVALKCYELARDAFSWVRYPQYPDKDIARVALTDARKSKTGALVSGRAGRGRRPIPEPDATPTDDGWRLTERGARWIAENRHRLDALTTKRRVRLDRQEPLRRLARITSHPAFQRFALDQRSFSPSLGELADLLRCRPDAPRRVWDRRFQAARNEAQVAAQQDVLSFLHACEDAVRTAGSGE
jgi:hypothetical protein